ncbi:MAG: PKD domain-containing protein [Candidatus Thorarchaeota archaeon]
MCARKRHSHRGIVLMGMGVALLLLVSGCALLNAPPKPSISISGGSPYGTAPLEVTFDISGSSDPDGEIVSFTFDFGDGADTVQGTDLSQPIEHTYSSTGSYGAKLTVVDNNGKAGSIMLAIMVNPAQ